MLFSLRTSILLAAAAASLGLVSARPINEPHPLLRRLDVGDTRCFTHRAAPASDCQSLLENAPATGPDWTNVASAGAAPVFKPFCNGSCCIFTDTKDVPTSALVSAGTTLLGCTEPANGLVNGITKTETAGVCLADATGAAGCFQESS
ncbi:hypothetical protein DFH09DRAFT_1332990 [Mycena vulgaris]|nr:hypothetical protein DFH09DRAFT_1332990 [Mycena vulgaris]